MNDQQEPLFSDDQTKLPKSMMASAVAEAMASLGKDTEDQPKDRDKSLTSTGVYPYSCSLLLTWLNCVNLYYEPLSHFMIMT